MDATAQAIGTGLNAVGFLPLMVAAFLPAAWLCSWIGRIGEAR